ncbi:MAG: Hsp70 family protein [Planctomycetota bacterium]|jgi:molecular chaperone DnaK
MAEQRYPVGIDLGTTFSSISYVDDHGRVETIRMEDGKFSLASAVYFADENEIVVGNEALNYALVEAPKVARDFKRHMGEADWTFHAGSKEFRPEELSAMVLKKLIEQARQKIGPVEDVVISVPFMFDEVRRRATRDAGRIAGLNVLDIVDEPVAGALAYGHVLLKGKGFYWRDEELENLFSDKVILVYDLGGGTFDLTMMRMRKDYTFETMATAGDYALGGVDWDKALADHLEMQFRDLYEENPKGTPQIEQEIRIKATDAKISLSERSRVPVNLCRLYRGQEETNAVDVARGDFEAMTAHLADRTRATLESMLEEKKMGYGHVDLILLIGGSSRMPMIRKMLEREIGRPINMSLSPDTAVANGAALFAAYRVGDKSMEGIGVETVNPHALGLLAHHRKLDKKVNDVLIEANQPTETEVTKSYPVKKGAKEVNLVVLQGELSEPEDCVPLGKVKIPNLSAEILDGAKVEVTFSFQQNGLLQVKGVVRPARDADPVKVDFDVAVEGAMSEDEITEAETALAGIEIE